MARLYTPLVPKLNTNSSSHLHSAFLTALHYTLTIVSNLELPHQVVPHSSHVRHGHINRGYDGYDHDNIISHQRGVYNVM
jgi:hypothetical protein